MIVRRFLSIQLAAIALVSVWSCSSLLGLDEFEDRTDGGAGSSGTGGAGGAGGGAGDSGSSGAGGSSGSGGSAGSGGTGGAPLVSCQETVPVFNVLEITNPTVFSSPGDVDPGSLLLVKEPESVMVHAVITGTKAGLNPAIAVQTVKNEDGDLGATRVHSVQGEDAGTFVAAHLVDGTATSSSLDLYGWVDSGSNQPNNAWVQVSMGVDSNGVFSSTSTKVAPIGPCVGIDAQVKNVAFAVSSNGAYIAASCETPTARQLVVGRWDAPPELSVPQTSSPGDVLVEDYVFANGVHLVQLAGSSYRFAGSNDNAAFGVVHQLDLAAGPFTTTNGIAILPRADGGNGALVIAARGGATPNIGELLAASLAPGEYSKLGEAGDKFTDVAPVPAEYLAPQLRFGIDPYRLTTAVVSGDSVRLHYLTRTGKPLLLGHEVYKAPTGATLEQAAAMPLNDSVTLVVWIESSIGGRGIRGTILNCFELP